MGYRVHLSVGKPLTGEDYPTLDENGVLTVPPPHNRTLQPTEWRKLVVDSEMPRDMTGMGRGAVARERRGEGVPMPERGRGKLTTDYLGPE